MVVSLLGWMFGWWLVCWDGCLDGGIAFPHFCRQRTTKVGITHFCRQMLAFVVYDNKSGNYPLLSTNASICQFPTFVVTYIIINNMRTEDSKMNKNKLH
jgi:hypothetical protein